MNSFIACAYKWCQIQSTQTCLPFWITDIAVWIWQQQWLKATLKRPVFTSLSIQACKRVNVKSHKFGFNFRIMFGLDRKLAWKPARFEPRSFGCQVQHSTHWVATSPFLIKHEKSGTDLATFQVFERSYFSFKQNRTEARQSIAWKCTNCIILATKVFSEAQRF